MEASSRATRALHDGKKVTFIFEQGNGTTCIYGWLWQHGGKGEVVDKLYICRRKTYFTELKLMARAGGKLLLYLEAVSDLLL